MAFATRVFDRDLGIASGKRRARDVGSRGGGGPDLGPATHEAHLVGSHAGRGLGAAQFCQQLAVAVIVFHIVVATPGIEPRELRQVDCTRVWQSADDFLREIMLDLLRPELSDEAS